MKMKLEDMMLPNDEYIRLKKMQYQMNKMKEQTRRNIKSQMGFGYNYEPVVFDSPDSLETVMDEGVDTTPETL